ncbi:hypothetical protein [Epilithonimonas sp. JDS]|uniref:hypothetical protein n=1 Tax=Epilithonimonas sp. JDS TaxID=2902797 RepID=UPI001E612533|nr:hypothetical protein [Epilithonimonas sp. JDS]
MMIIAEKKNKICYLLFAILLFGCTENTSNTNDNIINRNSYKGLGVFYYFEIDSGSRYTMVFIPFHFKENVKNLKGLSKQRILQNTQNIIFEKGLGFGTFSNENVFDEIFSNSQPCETKKYCFAYVDFIENDQTEIEKKLFDKKELSIRICTNEGVQIVKYYQYENNGRDLIKINTLKIIQ